MTKLPFEIRTITPVGHETNHTSWLSLSAAIINAQREAFLETPGLPQFVKRYDGVTLHWLSGSDLEYIHILNIFPVYPTPKKVEQLHAIFKAVA